MSFGAGCRRAYTTNTVSRRYAYISATHLQSMYRFSLDASASIPMHPSWVDPGMAGTHDDRDMPCGHAGAWQPACRGVRKHV